MTKATTKAKKVRAEDKDQLPNFADISVKDLLRPYRVTRGEDFRLKDHPTEDTREAHNYDKVLAGALLKDGIEDLQKLQAKLYADNRWSLLVIFQAMDAAGKDSTIAHVMSGVNPQGCHVSTFKRPSDEELDHDFLWRTNKSLPERGRIGIFNRSYYEEVLVVRVHPEILKKQRLPENLVDDEIWDQRLKAIRRMEHYLHDQGTKVVKFFLHVSKDEQKRRFLSRIEDPSKNWKFENADLTERARFDDYMHCYEEAIRATATKRAPWYVIPADDKKFMQVAVMAAIRRELKKLKVEFPELSVEDRAKLADAKIILDKESKKPVK